MRVRLKLESGLDRMEIPINYNGEVSRFVYELLQPDEPFCKAGYRSLSAAPDVIEDYTFSNLFIPQVEQEGSSLHFGKVPLEITISMLLPARHEQEVLDRIARAEPLSFDIDSSRAIRVTEVQVLAEPRQFPRRVRFRMSSPMASPLEVLAVEEDGKSHVRDGQVIHYSSPLFSDAVRDVLVARYVKCYGAEPRDTEFRLMLDQRYLQRRRGRISKLVTLDERSENERRIKAIIAPFECEGNPELIALGYVAGFGERTLLGFGCVEFVNDPPPAIRTIQFPNSKVAGTIGDSNKLVLNIPLSQAKPPLVDSIEGS